MKKFFPEALLPSALLASLALASSIAAPADAASMSFSVSPFTGSSAQLNFTLDDIMADSGLSKVQVRVDVDKSVNLADIRGIFFGMGDESLLKGLEITGSDITKTVIKANGVTSTGGDNNLNGGGGINPFDIGLEIGTSGIGKDDIQSTMFTVSHKTANITLAQFLSQSFGVRATSVGTAGNREGSSKLTGTAPSVVVQPPPPSPTPTPTPNPNPTPTPTPTPNPNPT
ncbi:hypothetical protein IQ268_18625, partial [Oculatella sp. LEGE 06141]|uniref:hypothetical protein n=1 Tax=Oculatella sp. LEGE 06141 TaxID=1828648 RepID=UPI00187F992D